MVEKRERGQVSSKKRTRFLRDYYILKENSIIDRQDNQFAWVEGCLYTLDVYGDKEWELTKTEDGGYKLITGDCHDEIYWERDLEGDLSGAKGFTEGNLYVAYLRKNQYTTQIDFYNSEIEVGFCDLLASCETSYFTVSPKTKRLFELYVDEVEER